MHIDTTYRQMEQLITSWRAYLLTEGNETPSELETKRQRRLGKPGRRSWVPGKDELDTLAIGITEKEDDKKNCSPGNPNHAGSDADVPGGFTSVDAPGSWSLDYHSGATGCEKGKLKKLGGKSTQWTKADRCGRDGEWLCSNPKKKKWDEMLIADDTDEESDDSDEFIRIRKSALERLLTDEIYRLIDEAEAAIVGEGKMGSRRKQEIAHCKQLGLKSFQEWLITVNAIKRAESGKLLDKEK